MSPWPPPSGGALSLQYVGNPGPAKPRPTLSVETSCWNAGSSGQSFFPWGAAHTRAFPPCKAHSIAVNHAALWHACLLWPSPHASGSLPVPGSCAQPRPASTPRHPTQKPQETLRSPSCPSVFPLVCSVPSQWTCDHAQPVTFLGSRRVCPWLEDMPGNSGYAAKTVTGMSCLGPVLSSLTRIGPGTCKEPRLALGTSQSPLGETRLVLGLQGSWPYKWAETVTSWQNHET